MLSAWLSRTRKGALQLRQVTAGPGIESLEVRCLLTGIELVSIDVSGDSAGSGFPVTATNPAITPSGRYVAFQSDATDLVTSLIDTNGGTDVFVRDRLLGITIPISVIPGVVKKTGDDRSFDPSISDDGRFVAFGSAADDLLASLLVIDSPINVFVHDRDTDKDGVFDEPDAIETRLLSLNGTLTGDGSGIFGGTSGGDAFGFGVESLRPRISGNGKFVVFGSFADNLALGISDPNLTTDVFRVPTTGGASPTMVSDDFMGLTSGANGDLSPSDSPDISRDGTIVAFVSEANNLIKDAEVGTEDDIYAHNFRTKTTTLVSMNFTSSDGGDADSDDPDLSNDGRYVAWESTATNLVAPGINTNGLDLDVFYRKVAGGPTELVSVNATGKTGDGPSEDPSISDAGRYVAFESEATDLITDPAQLAAGVVDTNSDADCYVRDMILKTTALVSINATGTATGEGFTAGVGGDSVNPVISGDGRFVVFESFAEDLVAGLEVEGRNLYVRDLVTGVTRLVSSDLGVGDDDDDSPNATSSTFQQKITTDGSTIAFKGDAPDLVSPDSNGSIDVFVSTGTPDLIASGSTSARSSAGIINFVYSRLFPSLIGPFEIGFYRSVDTLFDAGDGAPLITRSATGLSATLAGLIYTLGPITSLPGAGVPDDDEDYSLLAVVDHLGTVAESDADPFNEDNTVPFVADYQLSGLPWMVHGTSGADVITYSLPTSTSLELDFNDRSRTLPLASVPTTRIRAHGGDDVVTGSPLGDFIHGGDGDDTLFGGDGDDVIADGPGDDTIDGGLGDDTIISTPGSDDVFLDGGGNDTLNLSRDDQPISLDLDSSAVQTVDPLGNTLRLVGQWENFVGSPFGNTLYVRPISVPRLLVGGSGQNDRLILDGLGLNVTFDGSTITIPGQGDITVSGFEQVQIVNAAPRTIDDGDSGYSDTGFSPISTTQGFNSDVRFSASNSGQTATWHFTNLVPGNYAVSSTWTFAGDRAKNSPFSIRDGGPTGTVRATVAVNQEQNPGEFDPTGDGQNILFRNLAIITVTGTSLTVQLTDVGADQFVAADAIRIEPVSSRQVIDNGETGFTAGGFAPQILANNAAGRGAFGDSHLGEDVGDQATYSFSGLTPGRYVVSGSWTTGGDRATNAPFSASPGNGGPVSTTVSQQVAPDDFVEAGIPWERLLSVTVGPDGLLIVTCRVAAETNGLVIADAIRIDPSPLVDVQHVVTDPQGKQQQTVIPNEFRFARNSSPGDANRIRLSVRNPGLSPLELTAPQVTGAGFSLVEGLGATRIPPGGFTTFVIAAPASAIGNFKGQVTIGTNVFGQNPIIVDLNANVVDDTSPPTVNIVSPTSDTTLIEGGSVPIVVQAQDDLQVQRVELLVNGQVVATDSKSPFVFEFTSTSAGPQVITAVATDVGGNSKTSNPRQINVVANQPPVVSLVTPLNGDGFVAGQAISVQVDAHDDVSIERVEFLVDGVVAGTGEPFANGTFVGQILFPNTGSLARLQARVMDSTGQVASSDMIDLTLQNDSPPQVTIVTPLSGGQVVEGTTTQVRVEATDDVSVSRVELYINNVLVAETAASPLLFDLTIPAAGTNVDIQARAVDGAGNEHQTAVTQIQATPEPSGAVQAVLQNRVLQITGTGQPDQVRITSVGTGRVQVQGLTGTTINGLTTPVEFRNVRSVSVDLGDKADLVEFRGKSASSRLPTTALDLGNGDDRVNVQGVQFAGSLTVLGGAGSNTFETLDAVFQQLNYTGGTGIDQLMINGSNVKSTFRAELGQGNNVLQATDTVFSKPISITAGTDKDVVELTNVNAKSATEVGLSGGDDEFRATDSNVSGVGNVLLGEGNNTLTFQRVRVRKLLRVSAGEGDDTLSVLNGDLFQFNPQLGQGNNTTDLTGTRIRRT